MRSETTNHRASRNAYLDGTLFHRDARAVDEHLLTCANCTALLADMRRQRVTLDDGRVFNTVNGGVTWSAP